MDEEQLLDYEEENEETVNKDKLADSGTGEPKKVKVRRRLSYSVSCGFTVLAWMKPCSFYVIQSVFI